VAAELETMQQHTPGLAAYSVWMSSCSTMNRCMCAVPIATKLYLTHKPQIITSHFW